MLRPDQRMTDLVAQAAASNAAWCDAVCRTLGLPTRWEADAWTVPRRSPDGYPDAVTLARGVDGGVVLGRVDAGVGCSVKDSFADLDLAPYGFHLLFQATWIHRPAIEPSSSSVALDWLEARTPDALQEWSRGHGLDVFVPALLEVDGLRFFHTASGARFALYREGAVVGVSNIICGRTGRSEIWSDLVAVASRTYPGLDLVGYESETDLEAARSVGFVGTGPLQVWMR
jgi:hypothetical protein